MHNMHCTNEDSSPQDFYMQSIWLQRVFFAVHFVFWPKMASNGLKMRNSTRQYLPSLDAINKGGEGISMLEVYVFFLGWLEKCKNAFFAQKCQYLLKYTEKKKPLFIVSTTM